MRIQRKPSDELEINGANVTIDIYDEATVEVSTTYLFAAVLSCNFYL